jgi:molecular chaperone GrpE
MMERNPHEGALGARAKNEQSRADDAAVVPEPNLEGANGAEELPPEEPAGPSPEQQLAEMKDKVLRTLAEAENVRRRAERERDEASKFAVTNFARDVVSVADNLHRTLDSAKNPADSDAAKLAALVSGVELTERSLIALLEKYNVKIVEPLGQKFDPNLHQAMFEVPGTGKDPGTVVQVIQAGFTIAGRLLRPAMVGIAKAEAPKTDAQA